MLSRYQPSGRIGARFVPAFVVGLLAAVAIGLAAGGAAYLANWLFPVISLFGTIARLFISATPAVLIFAVAAACASRGHCRNRKLGLAVGLLLGVVTTVAAHAVMYAWAYRSSPPPHPAFLRHLAGRAAAPAMPVIAYALWTSWVVEAVAIVLLGGLGGMVGGNHPFCERCGSRVARRRADFTASGLSDDTLEFIQNAEDVPTLLALPPDELKPGPSVLAYRLTACRCGAANFLSIDQLVYKPSDDQAEPEEREIHEHLALTEEEAAAVELLRDDVLAILPKPDSKP